MESTQSSPEDTKQATFSITQLTRQLTKQLEELEKDKSSSSSSRMEPHRPLQDVTTSSSKKFVDEFDIALSPPSQSTTVSSTCDTNSTKTDSVPSTSNPLSPREWHSLCSSPPSVKSNVRSAQELIENLTALFACTREVIKNDVNLSHAHSSESKCENQEGYSLLQQPVDNDPGNDHVTRNAPQSSGVVELTKNTTLDGEDLTELFSCSSHEGTAHHNVCETPSTKSAKSKHCQPSTENSPTSETNVISPNSSSGQFSTSVVFSEIIQDNDIDLHQMAIEVDCSESHYLNLHYDSEHMFVYQTGTVTDSPNDGSITMVQDTNSEEKVGQVSSNQNNNFTKEENSCDEPTSEPGSQAVKGVTAVASDLVKGTSCTNDSERSDYTKCSSDSKEDQTASTISSNTGGRVLRKSCQRRARKFYSPTEQSDSERTLSASDDEERDWVMDGVQPRGRKRQRKGRKGSTSGSLARKIGRKSSKARQLLVKSKAVSLRKKQRQSGSSQLLNRGKPRKGHGLYESSDSSDGNMRRCLKERKPSRRSNTSQFKSIDEDYLPTPSKKQKTTATSRGQSSLKNAPSMGTILADILTDVPEVNIKTLPIPALNANLSESSTRIPSNEKKHARPLSLKVDHLPPQKRSKTKHRKSLRDNVLPESPSERIEESPTSKDHFKGDIPPTKPPYLGKVNLRLTSGRRSRMHSSSESTPLNSPELGLQNKPLRTQHEKQPRPVVKRTTASLKPSHLNIKSKTTILSDFSKHYRILMTWEKDYARGKNATKAPVLYAVEHMTDQIATEGEWLEKAKLIWNQWRHRVSSKERRLYSERAKENRKMLSATLPSLKTPSEPKMSEDGIPPKKSHVQQNSHKDTSCTTDKKEKLSSENRLQSATEAEPNNVSDPCVHSTPSTSSPHSTAAIRSSSNITTINTVGTGSGTHESYSMLPIPSHHDVTPVQSSSFSQTVNQQVTPVTVPPNSLERQQTVPMQLSQHRSPQTLSNLPQNLVSNTGAMYKPTSLTVSAPLTASGVFEVSKTSPVVPLKPETSKMTHSVVAQSDEKPNILSPTTSRVSESEADMKNRLSMLAYSLNSCIAGSPTTLEDLEQPDSHVDKKWSPIPLVAKSPSPQRCIEEKLEEFSFPITNLPTGMQLSGFVNAAFGSIPLQPVSPIVSTSFKFTNTSTAVSLVPSSSAQSVTSQNIRHSPQVNVPNTQPSLDLRSTATQSNPCTPSTADNGKQYATNKLNTGNETVAQHASQSFRPMKQGDTTFCKPVLPAWNVNNTAKSTTGNNSTRPPQYIPRMQNNNSISNTRKKENGAATKSLPQHFTSSSKPRKTSTKQGLSSYLERIPAGAGPSYVIPEIPLGDISANVACKSSSNVPPLPLPQQKNQQAQQQNTHNSMQAPIDQTRKFNPFMPFFGDQKGMAPSPFGAHALGTSKEGFSSKSFYRAPAQTTRTTTTPNNTHSAFHTNQTSFKLPTTKKKSPQNLSVSQAKTSTALPSMWYTTKHTNTGSRSSSTTSSPIISPRSICSPSDFPPLGTAKNTTSPSGNHQATLKYQQNSMMNLSRVTTPISQIPPVSTLNCSSGSWNPYTSVFSASQMQSTTPPSQSSSVFESSNTQPKQTIPLEAKQAIKRRASLNMPAAKLQPSTKTSEKHHRLDVLRKVQQLNRDRQQSTQMKQARSRSVSDETTKLKSSSGSLLAATISNTPTGSVKEIQNSSSSESNQAVAKPAFTPTIHNETEVFSFWQPTSTEMTRQPNQHSTSRRLSSERIPNDGQSSPSERISCVPNIISHSRLPSQSSIVSGTLSSSFNTSCVKVEQTSPVALVVRPPEQCSTLMSSTTPFTSSTVSSMTAIQPKSETEDNSMLQPNVVFNPSFNGDISTMSRWEIQQLYNHHKTQYEREKRILKSLKEKLIKMEMEEKSVAARKLSPDELYKRFLGFIVEPECPPCADSAFDRFHFKSETNNNVSPRDVLLGGTFDHPIINPKCDFYASFTK